MRCQQNNEKRFGRGRAACATAIGLTLAWLVCSCALRRTIAESVATEPEPEQKAARPGAREAVERFMRLAEERGRITRVVLRYRTWNAFGTHRSERAIFDEEVDCEVAVGPDMLDNYYDIGYIAKCLAMCTQSPRRASSNDRLEVDKHLDFCLAGICYAGEEEVIRFAVSKHPPPAVSINGELFDLSMPLVTAVRDLLPREAYNTIVFYVLMQWAPPPD